MLAGALLGWLAAPSPDAPGFVGLAGVGLLTVMLGRRYPAVAKPLLFAYLIRLALALVQVYVMKLPDSTADSMVFEARGWSRSQGPGSIWEGFGARTDVNYHIIVAAIYRLTGRCPLAVQALSVLCGTLTILEVYRLGSQLGGRSRGVQAAWVYAFFPTGALYSSIILREGIVAYLGVYATRNLVTAVRTRGFGAMVGTFIGYAAAGLLHAGFTLLIPVAALLIAWLGTSRGAGRPRMVTVAAAVAIAAVLVAVALQTGAGIDKFRKIIDEGSTQQLGSYGAEGGSRYLEEVSISGWGDVVAQAPLRTAYFLFGPFPWTIRSPHHVIGAVDAAFYIVAVLLVLRKRREIWARPDGRAVLIVSIILSVVYAMGTANFGTAIRHRVKEAPILLALAMLERVPRTRVASGAPAVPSEAEAE